MAQEAQEGAAFALYCRLIAPMITRKITHRGRNSRLSSSLSVALSLSLSLFSTETEMSRVTVFKKDTATLIMHPPFDSRSSSSFSFLRIEKHRQNTPCRM